MMLILLLNLTKIFLGYTASWANPIFRYIFKCSSGCNTIIRISYSWVIDIPTNVTYILFHNCFCFNE